MVTPQRYLELASTAPLELPSEDELLVVTGTVNLSVSPLRDKVRALPPARIEGDLRATGCHTLESVCCEVRDTVCLDGSGVRTLGPGFAAQSSFSANQCRNLAEVHGFFPSTVELEESGITQLSKEFRCAGDLYLAGCDRLSSLDCVVGGSVFANRSSVEHLGENFSCSQELHLTACPRIRTVPGVHGPPTDAYLADSGVERVEKSFSCSGSLVLKDVSRLVELSGRVGQQVSVSNAPSLESIAGLHAGRSLSVSNCPRLRVVRFTSGGSASFHRCGMKSLSGTTAASGELSVIDCANFRELGGRWGGDVTLVDLRALLRVEGTFVCDGDLTARSCPDLVQLSGRVMGRANLVGLGSLGVIGEDFSVIGDMVVDAADTRLGEVGCLVGGNFRIANAPRLASTSRRFQVGLCATFRACPAFRVLRGRVCGDAELKQGTAVEKIGADFECGGNLVISNCPPVESVNCVVSGDLVLDHAAVKRKGPAFRCGGRVVGECGSPTAPPDRNPPPSFPCPSPTIRTPAPARSRPHASL